MTFLDFSFPHKGEFSIGSTIAQMALDHVVSYLELDSNNGYERIEVIGWEQDDEVRSSKILVMYNIYNTVIDYFLTRKYHFYDIIFIHFTII